MRGQPTKQQTKQNNLRIAAAYERAVDPDYYERGGEPCDATALVVFRELTLNRNYGHSARKAGAL